MKLHVPTRRTQVLAFGVGVLLVFAIDFGLNPTVRPAPEPHVLPAKTSRPAASTDPLARGPFYVATLDSGARSYSIARYVQGRADPLGSVASVAQDGVRVCPGLGSPSVVRGADGRLVMYTSERVCGETVPTRLVRWTQAEEGATFRRTGTVLADPAVLGANYVVRDSGIYRVWYAAGTPTRGIYYAESRDGVRFRRIGGVRVPYGTPDYAVKSDGRWTLVVRRSSSSRISSSVLLTFEDPRQPEYVATDVRVVRENAAAKVAVRPKIDSRTLRLDQDGGFHDGDLVRIKGKTGATAAQVDRADGDQLHFDRPFGFRIEAGDPVSIAGPRARALTYFCRRDDGTWAGMFDLLADPDHLYEPVVAYTAPALEGPWKVDRSARAPFLALQNDELKRSAQSPTPITDGPSVDRCGD